MNEQANFQIAYELYNEATGALDTAAASRGLSRARALLADVISGADADADAFHLLGLCWYELPDGGDDALREAEAAFRAALTKEPDHQYANLYLGYVLFDTGRYREAYARCSDVNATYFAQRDQQWRVVKNEELKLCCRLQIDPDSVDREEVKVLCERYETDPVVEFIVPREIVVCIEALIVTDAIAAERAADYAAWILRMLERTDNLGINSLQSAIARLSRAARS